MIEGLILGKGNSLSSTIITPTPIKYQKSNASNMSTPTMISSHTYSSPTSNTASSNTANSSPTIDWTHDRILNLIQLYEKKSVLWNPSNPEYFHRDIRNMVYDDLVRELNIETLTVNETKRKLENLRSYFRRETKKLQDHERKTGEKLVSRWPYYESLQFIHEFMSVKNESGAETGFAKKTFLQNMARPATSYLPTMKSEPMVPISSQEECAVQVPVGSTPNAETAFQLANNDLVAVLKALQGPLAETAASCFVNSIGVVNDNSGSLCTADRTPTTKSPPSRLSPSHFSPPRSREVPMYDRSSTPTVTPLLPQNLALPAGILKGSENAAGENSSKRRKLHTSFERSISEKGEDDLCGDYGKTVAHQLRQMDDYNRDMCRLQIDQLIFDLMHKDKTHQKDTLSTKQNGTSSPPSSSSHN